MSVPRLTPPSDPRRITKDDVTFTIVKSFDQGRFANVNVRLDTTVLKALGVENVQVRVGTRLEHSWDVSGGPTSGNVVLSAGQRITVTETGLSSIIRPSVPHAPEAHDDKPQILVFPDGRVVVVGANPMRLPHQELRAILILSGAALR